jgi:hypothetical protein
VEKPPIGANLVRRRHSTIFRDPKVSARLGIS